MGQQGVAVGRWASLTSPSEISICSSLGDTVMTVVTISDSGREGASDVRARQAGKGQLCLGPPEMRSAPPHPPGAVAPMGELGCQGVVWPQLLRVGGTALGSRKLGQDGGWAAGGAGPRTHGGRSPSKGGEEWTERGGQPSAFALKREDRGQRGQRSWVKMRRCHAGLR